MHEIHIRHRVTGFFATLVALLLRQLRGPDLRYQRLIRPGNPGPMRLCQDPLERHADAAGGRPAARQVT